MKFNIKISKIENVKTDGRVEWNGEKKFGEIKIRYEDGQKILIVGTGRNQLNNGELQELAAKIGKKAKEEEIKNLAIPVLVSAEAIATGLILGQYEFRKYKSHETNESNLTNLEEIILIVRNANEAVRVREEIDRAEILCEATVLARDLVNEPSSVTTPRYLANLAVKMAKTGAFICKVYDQKEIEKIGMGLFLGVAKGSDEPPRFLELRYSGRRTDSRLRGNDVVLVGKGITFDTGGLSLKPQEGMETMKMDMAGAASVLAIFSVLAKLKIKTNVVGLIPLTENMPSGKAIKPGDILKSFSGKTVEVLNTDAEGRLILADALSYGLTFKPDLMIDLATLTGACMVALGENISGLFSSDQKVVTDLLEAGQKAGEKLWNMPLEKSYQELLKSNVADLKNVTGKKYGGAITAALFLKEFVGNAKWVHLDIAGPAWEEAGTELTPKGGTGFAVRTILNFLEKI